MGNITDIDSWMEPFLELPAMAINDGQVAYAKFDKLIRGFDKLNRFDLSKVRAYYQSLAEQEHVGAQLLLGVLYLSEWGGVCDPDITELWWHRAAKQGHPVAQCWLAEVREKEAEEWLRKAAEQGYAAGQYLLGELLEKTPIGADNYISKRKEVNNWYSKAADQGDLDAIVALGRRYYGSDIPGKLTEAVELFQKAIGQGSKKAMSYLGMCHYDGRGINRDYPAAYRLFQEASSAPWQDSNCMLGLGLCYFFGHEVDQNITNALDWFSKSAEEGASRANCYLRNDAFKECLIGSPNGRGEVGKKIWLSSNHKIVRETACIQGKCSQNGFFRPNDIVEAFKFFSIAASERIWFENEDRLPFFPRGDEVAIAEKSMLEITRELTPAQISEIQAWAIEMGGNTIAVVRRLISELNGVASGEKTPKAIDAEYICMDFEQGTSEWLKWRDSGIGGSDAPTILGENPWKSASSLLAEKLGDVEPFSGNAATRRGTQLEPEARELYEQIKNTSVEPICLQSTKYPWMLASLDGMSPDRSTVVEIKCGEGVYQKTASTRKVPQYYMGQLQHILAVTGLPSIDFFCYLPSRDPICLTVERDDAYISRLIVAEEAFWRQVLEGRAGE